jgi:hypothetical protein
MKQLAIISIFLLLLTGCGNRVNQDTLVELSVKSMIEFSERMAERSSQNLESSILNLSQATGLEPRTSELAGEILYCADAHLDDGTNYSISGYDRKDGAAVLITIINSEDNTIPQKMCERIRSLALERGLVLSYMTGADKIRGGYFIVQDMKDGLLLIIGEERRY